MTWKLFLPLENHLWHKPSEVMFSHSLHLPLSQFWAPVLFLWYHYQSLHRFASSRLQTIKQVPGRTGLKTLSPDLSWIHGKAWSLDSERPRCFTGGVEREEVADSILFFTTSCSCHIEAVSNWPPTILSCPIISQLIESISGYTNSQPCCTCKAAVQSGCSYFLYCNVHAYCIFWVGTQSEALPPSKAPWGWG